MRYRFAPLCCTAAIWLLACCCLVGNALPAQSLTPAQYQALQSGKVLVSKQTANADTAASGVQAIILIKRPIDQVWKVVRNTETLFAGDPVFQKVQVVDRPSPKKEIVKYDLRLAPFLPVMSYTGQVDFREPYVSEFKRIAGSFEAMDGKVQLKPGQQANETILAYSLKVKPGMPLPQTVVNKFVSSDLPHSLRRVEQQVYKTYPPSTQP